MTKINIDTISNYIKNNIKSIIIQDGIMQRGIGDILEYHIYSILKTRYENIKMASSKRSIEDFQIIDGNKIYKFDVKTHDIDSKFSMPNLISIKRLNRYYKNDNNNLIYIFINYKVDNNIIIIKDVKCFYIHQLDWSCIHIQNIGKGQLQIKNSNNIILNIDSERSKWYKELKYNIKSFYMSLIESIKNEIEMI